MDYLLAIETSGRAGSVALLGRSDQQLTVAATRALDPAERTARSLFPAIDQLLRQCQLAPRDLAGIGVTVGPGSFTGLRIAVTAAKTLAYATHTPLVGLNTLDVLAIQAGATPASRRRVWGVMNAERGDLFAACYSLPLDLRPGREDATRVVATDAWLKSLEPGDLIVGPAASRYAEQLPEGVSLAADQALYPTAAAVGRLAATWLAVGEITDPFALLPKYYRPSAAEEKRSQSLGPTPNPS